MADMPRLHRSADCREAFIKSVARTFKSWGVEIDPTTPPRLPGRGIDLAVDDLIAGVKLSEGDDGDSN